MDIEENEKPIYIYIDNSNLFIEAQSEKVRDDSRARVDIGKVCGAVANKRPVAQRFLYGSEPPPVKTVWEKIKGQDVDVILHQKSRQGKEKQVDTQIVADITERVCLTPIKERSTIVVITGDADMIPGIEKALQYGWKVEVAMWDHAMSPDYKKRDKVDLTLTYLDEYLLDITFINRMCSIFDLNTIKRCKAMESANLDKFAVVLKVQEENFEEWHYPKEWIPNDEWCEKVENLAECKFQYDWADFEDSQKTKIFGLVLCFGEKEGGKDKFMAEINSDLATTKKTELFIIDAQEYRHALSMKTRVWNGSERGVAYLREKPSGQKRSSSAAVKNEDKENENTANKRPKKKKLDNTEMSVA